MRMVRVLRQVSKSNLRWIAFKCVHCNATQSRKSDTRAALNHFLARAADRLKETFVEVTNYFAR